MAFLITEKKKENDILCVSAPPHILNDTGVPPIVQEPLCADIIRSSQVIQPTRCDQLVGICVVFTNPQVLDKEYTIINAAVTLHPSQIDPSSYLADTNC